MIFGPIFGATRISQWQLEGMCLAESAEALKILVDAGAEVNVRDSRGETPLHSIFRRYAAFDYACGCDAEVAERKIKILLDAGTDVNARDENGNTPLHLMVEEVFQSSTLKGERANALEALGVMIDSRGDNWIKNQADQTPFEYGKGYCENVELMEKVKQHLGLQDL